MRRWLQFGLLGTSLLAGCATSENIPLSDDAQVVGLEKQAALPPPAKPSLGKAERQEIERIVFAWLLQRPLGEDNVCTAVFLQADESTTTAFQKEFPEHRPPIKQLWHLEVRPGQSPRDKDTGRPAMILSVDVAEPENSGVAAIGKWSAGDAAAGYHTFDLKQTDAGWQIQSVK